MTFSKSITTALAAFVLGCASLSALPRIAYDPSSNTTSGYSSFTGSVGLVFTVNDPLTVTELGIVTNSNEPLDSGQLKTRLYQLNDPQGNTGDASLLAERNFTAGLASTISGIAPWGWRIFFQPPSASVTLVPGKTYLIASQGFGGSPNRSYINSPNNVVLAPEINHLQSRYGAADSVPTTPNGNGIAYQGPTFRFESPEKTIVLSAPERDPASGEVRLVWTSAPDRLYWIEASPDLQSWEPIADSVPSAGTTTTWVDLTAVNESRRFYRISDKPSSMSRAGLTAIDGGGNLHLDRDSWLARNNLVYLSPPFRKNESIPLGSGRVGAALWIDPTNGLTAHLNRPEGVPAMAGIGMLRIPGLAGLASAPDYRGVLSLHDGVFTQQSGGLIVTSFFRWGGEELVINVQGADPEQTVTAELSAYTGGSGHGSTTTISPLHAIAGESPANEATGDGCIAIASGDGSTARYPGFRATQFIAARAVGREVHASANTDRATLTFKPNPDGSYRLVIPVKIWTGSPVDATTLKPEALVAFAEAPDLATGSLSALIATQSAAFGARWNNTAIIRLYSPDGAGRFIEQMLALDTYFRISGELTPLPAVGGGETRLFSWNPVGVFNRNHWYQNLRPINYANISSGVWGANSGTWDWLLGWLPELQQHVSSNFPGYEGAGYPEYIDGQPGTAGSLLVSQNWGTTNIAPEGTKWYTSRMMSTTLEMVSVLVTEYSYRQDAAFLEKYWPLIQQGMLFHRSLLMAKGLGSDGRYHYLHVNSRENNWDDDDDTPDVAGIINLLPIVIDLAQQRGDSGLVTKLGELVGKLPEIPTETRTHPGSGLQVSAIAWSALTRSTGHNGENPDLDAIWPANAISDASDPAMVQLANDTLDTRFFRETYDWHPTAVQAARMGRSEIYRDALLGGISRFLAYPQGFGSYDGGSADVQTEFTAVQTLGAHEALVQNHDGLLRLASSWPSDWQAIALLPVEGGHRVAIEVIDGVVQTSAIDLGSSVPSMRIRNPWPGESFDVRDLTSSTTLHSGNAPVATVPATVGHRLLVERGATPLTSLIFEPAINTPNSGPTKLGIRKLGKFAGDTPQ